MIRAIAPIRLPENGNYHPITGAPWLKLDQPYHRYLLL